MQYVHEIKKLLLCFLEGEKLGHLFVTAPHEPDVAMRRGDDDFLFIKP